MHGTFPRRRIVRRDDSWTFRETEAVRNYWPDMDAIHRAIPYRTDCAIRSMAKKLGLIPEKEQHIWTCVEDKTLRKMASEGAPRKEIAAALRLTVLQVANRLNYCRIKLARRPPIALGDGLVDAVRRRAFDMRISFRDLDRSLGRKKVFSSSTRDVSPHMIHQAVTALGGKLTIEWPQD